MSVYNKPELKYKVGSNTPSYSHKKNNSLNFTMGTGKFIPESSNKNLYKNNLDNKSNIKINTDNNISNYKNIINSNSNINKLLTSTNLKHKRIEIDLNRENSNSKFNNTERDNIILLKNKHSTSQNDIISNKSYKDENNNNKECNIIINNLKEKNNNKSKSNLNNLNNINININISKKIISTYYNKSKDKKNIVIKKNSVNSLNGPNLKQTENTKYYRINNKDNINKNPSEIILSKFTSNDQNILNINNSSTNTNTNKSKNNKNHSLYFSSNSNKNILYNKTNSNNTYKSNHINYTSNDIYNNTNNNNANLNYKNYKKKNNGSVINKNVKDNKSMYLSQIQIPMNASYSPRNINSIQNYLKYLNLGQNNKNFKNSPQNRSKNQNQKFSASNINSMNNNNNVENSVYNNNKSNYEKENEFKHNTFNNSDINNNVVRNCSPKNKNSKVKKRRNESNISLNNEIGDFNFENPEELHYFYVKIFQKGKIINFDDKNK